MRTFANTPVNGEVAPIPVVRRQAQFVNAGEKMHRRIGVKTHHAAPPTAKSALVVGWSGMRGIVTLAAAMALPAGFPDRDFIQLTAFTVVLGTLVLQGLSLRPLLLWLRLPKDSLLADELRLARETGLKAALEALAGDTSTAAQRLHQHYAEALAEARRGGDPRD